MDIESASRILDSSAFPLYEGYVFPGEIIEYARIILLALSVPDSTPTLLATENLANGQVVADSRSAARSRHFLIRYDSTKEREQEGIIAVIHVPDAHMLADYLTKRVTA